MSLKIIVGVVMEHLTRKALAFAELVDSAIASHNEGGKRSQESPPTSVVAKAPAPPVEPKRKAKKVAGIESEAAFVEQRAMTRREMAKSYVDGLRALVDSLNTPDRDELFGWLRDLLTDKAPPIQVVESWRISPSEITGRHVVAIEDAKPANVAPKWPALPSFTLPPPLPIAVAPQAPPDPFELAKQTAQAEHAAQSREHHAMKYEAPPPIPQYVDHVSRVAFPSVLPTLTHADVRPPMPPGVQLAPTIDAELAWSQFGRYESGGVPRPF